MSTQEPQCIMYRDGYGCDGKSEVLLVVYPDNTYELLCRKCYELYKCDLESYKDTKAYTLGQQV